MTTQKFKAGDWVKRFERVTKVTDDNGVFYYLQGLGWVTEESIEPMPLTEDVLIKAGFTQYGDESNSFEIDYCVINLTDKKMWLAVPSTSGFGKEIQLIAPNYLHQLQNIIHSLRGEELDIKL
jgi:hypothetical protein